MKKISAYLFIAFLIFITHYALYTSTTMNNLDYKIYDFSRGFMNSKSDSKSNVVIVDIDERSLNTIGQWPWPRVVLSSVLSRIASAVPSAIAIDIIFAEKDRTSLSQIKSFYKNYFNVDINVTGLPSELEDNDAMFSEVLKKSGSVMSVYLSKNDIFSDTKKCNTAVDIPLKLFELENYPFILQNISVLSSGIENFGFINAEADKDGILRRYPLVRRYQQIVLPSLPLATLLSIDSNLKTLGEKKFELMKHQFKTDNKSNVLLSYYEDDWYKKISAIDLLSGRVNAESLRGKIVLLGSSAVALHDHVVIPSGKSMAGVQVHATMIDNILHDELLVQPEKFSLINIFISLFFTLLLLFLLFKKANNLIIVFFVTILFFTIFANAYALYNSLYISIGYLIIPFLLHFFLISIVFIFIDTYDRKEFSEELNRSHIAFMDSMSHVAEVHDFDTGTHIIRTKKYIKLLAEYIVSKGLYKDMLSKEMINMMYLTAPMHDIGKVGIPDSVLKKAGKLTAIEFEVMMTHPNLGKHIMNNAISSYKENDFLVMARNIAYSHHEKWDGSGYPEGLKGKEIPLEARFMAISDVYDALVNKRIYKEAYTFEKTLEIIKDGRGTHFDPVLVDAFLEISDEFQKIAETYRD